jgi:hypothetical protein
MAGFLALVFLALAALSPLGRSTLWAFSVEASASSAERTASGTWWRGGEGERRAKRVVRRGEGEDEGGDEERKDEIIGKEGERCCSSV